MSNQRIRLGDLLIQQGLITDAQLNAAVEFQKNTGGKLGSVLVQQGYITEEQLLTCLADQIHIPFVDIRHYQFDPSVIKLLPEMQARRFRALVLAKEQNEYLVGMQNPQDLLALDAIESALGTSIKPVLVQEVPMLKAFDAFYDNTQDLSKFAEELTVELAGADDDILALHDVDEDAPVVKLLQTMFEQAVRNNASDIHIEPAEKTLLIRTRIDGKLQEQIINETKIIAALIQRLKLMAGLNIAEKRLPQDGRFAIKVNNLALDVRLSTMPMVFGESVVLRLLPQANKAFSLDQIGMPEIMLKQFRKLCYRPHGMILVTGPTGSGKTSTLYGVLDELNRPELKIITVEDPVEIRLPRICQVQVNTKIDLTFAKVLRATLRQDPDILMVGEIRDKESATIAIRAAMTGHLVLATLHTTSARSSILRLIDMGVPGYLVAIAIRGIVAQRLVRRICEYCKQAYTPTADEMTWLSVLKTKNGLPATFFIGRGCTHCNNTGYRGRIGIYELIVMNNAMIDAIRNNDYQQFEKIILQDPEILSLADSAITLAMQGITSLSEALSIAEFLEDE